MKNIYELFLEQSYAHPDKAAIFFEEEVITYKELRDRVELAVSAFCGLGVKACSKVAIIVPNSPVYAEIFLALSKIGAAVMPLPVGFKKEQKAVAINRVGCRFVLGIASSIEQLREMSGFEEKKFMTVDRQIDGCELLCKTDIKGSFCSDSCADVNLDFIYTMTSGSTGEPKPIVFSQKTKIDRAFKATKDVYGLSCDDVVLVSTPLYHSLAQRSLLMPLMMGASVLIMPKFTPSLWASLVCRHRVSFLFAVSSQLESVVLEVRRGEYDFSSLKTVISSSAPLKDDTKLLLLDAFSCDIREIYGASEVGVATELSLRHEKEKYSSVGKPLSFVDIKICSDERETLKVGEIGEIAVKSETRFVRYDGLLTATTEAFDGEGYFFTGDLGRLDSDGYLYYLGRKKDVIITGGINVYPKDIEDAVLSLPGVKEAAAVGVENSIFGESILLLAVCDDGVTKNMLQKACMDKLADYQQPIAYEIVKELPKNEMGKLVRHKLKDAYRNYDISTQLDMLKAIRG